MKYNTLISIMNINDLKKEKARLERGCGKKVNSDGDCYYYSSQGNLRLCASCTIKLNMLMKKLNN